jgi:hypothetical protein
MGVGPDDAYNRGRMQRVSRLIDGEAVQVEGLTGIVAGGYHALAMAADGSLLGWGHNGFGQLGDSTPAGSGRAGARGSAGGGRRCVRGATAGDRAGSALAGGAAAVRPSLRDCESDRRSRSRGHRATAHTSTRRRCRARSTPCMRRGGGTVLVPAVSIGPACLSLKSGVRLHLAEGATLLGSTNRDHYEPRGGDLRPGRAGDRDHRQWARSTGTGRFTPNRGWRHNVDPDGQLRRCHDRGHRDEQLRLVDAALHALQKPHAAQCPTELRAAGGATTTALTSRLRGCAHRGLRGGLG